MGEPFCVEPRFVSVEASEGVGGQAVEGERLGVLPNDGASGWGGALAEGCVWFYPRTGPTEV